MKDRIASFGYAFNGLKVAFREEPNFRIHLVAVILVIMAGIFLDVSRVDWAILLLTAALVIITELLNTAIENICDFIQPEQDVRIGRIKDVCAAAVLVSAIAAIVIAVIVFWPYVRKG